MRSLRVESKIEWPSGEEIVKQYYEYKKGKCKKLDFRVRTYSIDSRTKETYNVTLSYLPVVIYGREIFFPSFYSHTCHRTDFHIISFGDRRIICKHVYSAMDEVAREAKKYNIPIDTTILLPNELPKYFEEILRIIEDKKKSVLDRLKYSYCKLIGGIYNSFDDKKTIDLVWSIIIINKTIERLSVK